MADDDRHNITPAVRDLLRQLAAQIPNQRAVEEAYRKAGKVSQSSMNYEVRGRPEPEGERLTEEQAMTAVDAEPELPGDPPAELLAALHDPATAVRVLRATVTATKSGIKARLRAALRDAPPQEGGRK